MRWRIAKSCTTELTCGEGHGDQRGERRALAQLNSRTPRRRLEGERHSIHNNDSLWFITHRLGAERPEAQAAQVVAREHGLGFGVGHDHPEESGAGLVRSVTGRRVLMRHAGGETT